MMKKMFAVLLSACMLLAVSACSQQQNEVLAADEGAAPESSQAPETPDADEEAPEDAADTADPAGENPIIAAIERRNSTGRDNFTGKEIDEETLHLLAWAATGTNRSDLDDGEDHFVVPLAMGADPFVSVYLAQESGVRRYSWQSDSFEDVSDLNILSQATLIDLSGTVTAIWIFVIEVEGVPMDNLTWAYHAIGAMSEHQYLVAEEFGVQARYMAAVNAEAVSELLELSENQLPAGVMMMAAK